MLRRTFCRTLSGSAVATHTLLASKSGDLRPRTQLNGWIRVQLQGTPTELGRQHGQLLAPEIADALKTAKLLLTHGSGKDWAFFRQAAERVLWPQIEQEYRDELNGLVEGAKTKAVEIDIWDVVALNAMNEFVPYYTDWFDKKNKVSSALKTSAPEHCSAFVATGAWTADGKPVIAHNNWSDYAIGARWNIIFDVRPAKGLPFIMDGVAGLIHSGDDFGVNQAGLVITETTISGFSAFDPKGIAEFVRARKAMQYASNIDEFSQIMRTGNNGGYANNWLIADTRANEIASLELGLKHVKLQRTPDGCFVGSNFPADPDLAREETNFKIGDPLLSPNARHKRWDALMAQHKGKIDVEMAKRFLADHHDVITGSNGANERTLCGHNDVSSRGMQPWQPAYGPAGAVQNKVSSAKLAAEMGMWAAMGHACGEDFHAAQFLKQHPEFNWQKPILKDLISGKWTYFRA